MTDREIITCEDCGNCPLERPVSWLGLVVAAAVVACVLLVAVSFIGMWLGSL